ncbi:MAG: ATP-binding protein [Gemmatimonadaceae bacterium]
MFKPTRVLRWMYIGRLALATAIFIAALFLWEAADVRSTLVATLTFIGAFSFTGISVWYSTGAPDRSGRTFRLIQSLFDVAMVTAIVHITGGPQSPFVALYILVTACATLLIPARSALLIAALGSALYFADALFSSDGSLAWTVIFQVGVFAAVAIGTAYLGTRLRQGADSREELEQALAYARLQAEDILRNIRSGVVTVDARGRLLYANPAAGHLLGFDADTSLGRQAATVLGATAPVLVRVLERAVDKKERVNRGEATITVDGRVFPIGLTTTTIDDGTPAGISATAIFQDISDTKRLEELRLRAERLEGVAELSASLAHEIKNPLASIRSAVEQLGQRERATEDERTLSTLIVRESDRLARLLSEFLDFARTRVTRIDRVDIVDVAKAAAHLAAAHPTVAAGVTVTCTAPDELILVEGDEDLLHRAMFNITLNAVQAAPAGGTVTVEIGTVGAGLAHVGARFDSDAVAVCVSDNGSGIPDDVRERVFDPFFTTKPGGTGLGLPIAHRAIEAHRGVMLVDSSVSGTSFTVLLPRSQPKHEDIAPIEIAPPRAIQLEAFAAAEETA